MAEALASACGCLGTLGTTSLQPALVMAGLSAGAIAGIVVGVLIAVAVLAYAGAAVAKNRKHMARSTRRNPKNGAGVLGDIHL